MPRVCAAIFFLCLALWASHAQAAERPNIILITIDTFRADRIGYYGNPRDTSPALDAFAREGVFFRQAFSSSGWTTPGLISILTSLYAPTHAVDIRGRRLDSRVETLPDVLRRAGYRAPDIFFLTEIPNFDRLGFEPYGRRQELLFQGDEILFNWLEREAGESASPFFLYYHYRDLHLPYDPGPGYDELYLDEAFAAPLDAIAALKRFIAHEKMDLVKRNVMITRGDMDFAARDSSWVRALYDAEIRRLDDLFFARLRRVLRETGLGDNTIVVVSADHGEALLDRELVGHISTFKEGYFYDDVTRIPLVMWMPGRLPAGRVVDEPVQCIDIMPTLLNLVDVEAPETLQGRSLMSLIEGDPDWQPRTLYFESSAAGYTANPEEYERRFLALRTAEWKLIHDVAGKRYELYDLRVDPYEENNLWSRQSALGDSLANRLHEWNLYAHQSAYRSGEEEEERAVGAVEAVVGPPQILFPADGDTLHYQGAEHEIRLHWSGSERAQYAIEYVVGEGAYHLAGEITEGTNRPVYGPFQAGFWNSLVLYNPWKFRVYRTDRPQEKSAWVTFHLAPSVGAQAPSWNAAMMVPMLLAGSTDLKNLFVGLVLGMGDLWGWLLSFSAADLSAYTLIGVLMIAVGQLAYARIGVARTRAWGWAMAYIAFVYSTIPLLPDVWAILREYTQGAVRHLGTVVIAAGGVALLIRLMMRMGKVWWRYIVLVAIAVLYAHLLGEFARFPAERLHLVEYGFMGYVLLRALRCGISPPWSYLVAWLAAVVVGVGDECIQWVLPQRYFEVKDIQLNAISAALGLMVAWLARGSSAHKERHA